MGKYGSRRLRPSEDGWYKESNAGKPHSERFKVDGGRKEFRDRLPSLVKSILERTFPATVQRFLDAVNKGFR